MNEKKNELRREYKKITKMRKKKMYKSSGGIEIDNGGGRCRYPFQRTIFPFKCE